MPNNAPFQKWYWSDWFAATAVLSPEARGIWHDLLGVMFQMDHACSISGDVTALSRAGRCSVVQLEKVLNELATHRIAEIAQRDGIVTVTCRRFRKEKNERKRAREGMARIRMLRKNYGKVTPMLQENLCNKEREKKNPPAPPFKEKNKEFLSPGTRETDIGPEVDKLFSCWLEILREQYNGGAAIPKLTMELHRASLLRIAPEYRRYSLERAIKGLWKNLYEKHPEEDENEKGDVKSGKNLSNNPEDFLRNDEV